MKTPKKPVPSKSNPFNVFSNQLITYKKYDYF